jgi:hypothetical protein
VPLRILRILTVTGRIAANVILLADAPGMHRAQLRKLLFHRFDLILNLFCVHADIITKLSVYVNKKMPFSGCFFVFFFAFRLYGRQCVPFTSFPLAEVYPLKQQSQFPGCDLLSPGIGERVLKRPSFKAFIPDRPTVPVSVQDFQAIGTAVTENQQMSGKRITADNMLRHRR